jgi:hydrogenase-4 component E
LTGIATFAGALALSLSLVVQAVSWIDAALRVCALQAVAVAVAVGALGWAHDAASLYVAAFLALALNGVALPLALRRLIGRAPAAGHLARRYAASLAASFALVAASVAAMISTTEGVQFELLALGLSVLLLGLLFVVLGSHRLMPALGLLSSQNGIALAACAIVGLPPSALLLATVPLVPSLIVANTWLRDRNRLASAPPWT